DPRILFYDEPSAGLDPVTSAEIDQLIIDLNRKLGVTSVVVTHEMDSAFRIADRMVLLDRGKFIISGTADELRNSTDPLVHLFVIVSIKGVGRLTDPTDLRTVRFKLSDNVGGLRVGDDVRVGGMKVGVVKDIDLEHAADGNDSVIVWFTFPRRIELHPNAHVAIESTLTGSSDLNVDDLGS